MSDLQKLLTKIESLPEVEEDPSHDERMLAALNALTAAVSALTGRVYPSATPEDIARLEGAMATDIGRVITAVEGVTGTVCARVDEVLSAVSGIEIPVPPRAEKVDLSALETQVANLASVVQALALSVGTPPPKAEPPEYDVQITGRDGNGRARTFKFTPRGK